MTRQKPTRRRVAAALLGFTLVAAGCTNEPEPEPPPPATYQQASEKLCEQIGMPDILRRRWQLGQPPEEAADPYYDASAGLWITLCPFRGVAEDGRYATKLKFRPAGRVKLTVYEDLSEAELRFGEEAAGERRRIRSIDPGGSVTEISGWWDAGISVKLITGVDSGPLGFEDPGSTKQAREVLIRHDNLVVRSSVEANAPTADRVEVGKLLDEIVAVMLDESVKHLPRTG